MKSFYLIVLYVFCTSICFAQLLNTDATKTYLSFNAKGNFTVTMPAGVLQNDYYLWGSGGGGSNGRVSPFNAGSGGGGGGFLGDQAVPSMTRTLIIGGSSRASNGGQTSYGSFIANGGKRGGLNAAGGLGGSASATTGTEVSYAGGDGGGAIGGSNGGYGGAAAGSQGDAVGRLTGSGLGENGGPNGYFVNINGGTSTSNARTINGGILGMAYDPASSTTTSTTGSGNNLLYWDNNYTGGAGGGGGSPRNGGNTVGKAQAGAPGYAILAFDTPLSYSIDNVTVSGCSSGISMEISGILPAGNYTITYTVDSGAEKSGNMIVTTVGTGKLSVGSLGVGEHTFSVTKLSSGKIINQNTEVVTPIIQLPISPSVDASYTVPVSTLSVATPAIASHSYCLGVSTPTSLNPTSTGGVAPVTYGWYSSEENYNSGGTAIALATSETYLPSVTAGGVVYYYLEATDANGCTAATDPIRVAVDGPSISPSTISMSPGDNYSISLEPSLGTSGTWSTTNNLVATVDSEGEITVVGEGNASINYIDNLGCSALPISIEVSPLPITLISFNGKRNVESNLIEWKVVDAINFKEFRLEKSNNGRTGFQNLNAQPYTDGISSYRYKDSNILEDAYYRLALVDLDGTIEYSRIIFVHGTDTKVFAAGEIFPNPAQQELSLDVFLPKTITAVIGLVDLQGRMVKPATQLVNDSGLQKLDISMLKPGIYLLNIQASDGRVVTRKIVKTE